METIKGAVDTASKALFGDQAAKHGEQGQHVEPQSGVTGNTTRGEPYDGGNLDQSNPGAVSGQGYSQQDDAHAFQTSHEIPRGEGAIGSTHTHQGTGLPNPSHTHTHQGTGSGLTGGSRLTGGSSNAGPHDSNVANKLDPRVDSDRDGRSNLTGFSSTGSGLTGSSHTGTGSGLTGGYGGSSNAGPHDSNVANKLDPRVDSDRDGRSGVTGSSHTDTTGGGLLGSSGGYGSSNAGPHDSNIANKADPRVDSDRDGRSGLTGSSNTGSGLTGSYTQSQGGIGATVSKAASAATGGAVGGTSSNYDQHGSSTTGDGLTGTSGGYGSSNAGPHDSNLANKADPRVDSDRDGRSGLTGSSNTGSGLTGSNTQSQGGISATLSKAASAVTGKPVEGTSSNYDTRGPGYDNKVGGNNNNNLGEYSMDDATRHATSGQTGQPHIADASHRADTHRHQGANDPLDQPGHHESHAIRDTKNEAERKLDPRNDSHGPGTSSGVVGQNPDSVRHGSLTANLPGAPGGEGLKSTTGEGTGKQYVKSTGLAAEGGDFDASRPGAGKEADRLLEEHGIHHGEKEHVGHDHEEASSKMAGGHTTTGMHSHGARTGTAGTLGAHDDKHRDAETASTTAIRHGVPGQSTTHTSTTGAHTGATGAHSGAHTGAPDTATGSHTGTHTGTSHDEKPSLKDKIKAKIHMS